MNDLESIILSLFDEGYTKSEIASQLDETLAKASSETEKARHDALVAKDAANIHAAIAKYYTDKYNDSTSHYSIEDITELLDSLYSDDICIICADNTTNPDTLDAIIERIKSAFYDYWYFTHDNTEIEITPEEITYILESYYNRNHDETTPQLLANIAELVDVYFMRTRKNYHGREIYKWFPHPDDFADYLDTINFPNANPFHDPSETLAQAIDTFLVESIGDYKSGTLAKMFPESKDVGDYVLTLYKSYKYLQTLGLNNKTNFSDMLNAIFNA